MRSPASAVPAAPGVEAAGSSGLREEGAILARYILRGDAPAPAVLDRYEAACSILFGEPPGGKPHPVLRFVRSRPWSLRFLDGGATLLEPESLLRKKLLLMLAILETEREHSPFFTPRPCSRPLLAARILLLAGSGAVSALLGLLLYPIARRARET